MENESGYEQPWETAHMALPSGEEQLHYMDPVANEDGMQQSMESLKDWLGLNAAHGAKEGHGDTVKVQVTHW